MEEQYVIIRADRAACFAGVLVARTGREVTLRDARRLWSWAGAATLSELAVEGTAKPDGCRFPVSVPGGSLVLDVVEVLPVTDRARASIESVPVWSAR